MNTTGAIVTAVGVVLSAMITVLAGWFVKRTDNAAKLSRASLSDQQYIMKLVGVLRDDVWAVVDWGYNARSRFNLLREWARQHQHEEPPLEAMPTLQHRALEKRHADGTPNDDDEK